MKYGFRKPSVKKSVKARTTGKVKRAVKKSVNPLYGKKGVGFVNNPEKAVYNKVYNKATFGVKDVYDVTNRAYKNAGSANSNNNANINNSNKKRKKVKVPIGEHATTISERIIQTVLSIVLFAIATVIILWFFLHFSIAFKIILIGICLLFMVILIVDAWKRKTTTEYKSVYEDELTDEDIRALKEKKSSFKVYANENTLNANSKNKEFNTYATAVFLNAYKKSCPIMPDSEYYKYLKTECRINKPSAFHQNLISEGYLISDSDNTLNYSLSEKGNDYLLQHNDCLNVHKFKKYDITWQDYCSEKQKNPNSSFDEIVWNIFNERFNMYCRNCDWGFARNIELYRAQMFESKKEYEKSFYYYLLVFYFDLSGCTNNNYIESFEEINNYAPGIQKKLKKYSQFYNDEMIDECYNIKLPHYYYDKNSFKEILRDCLKK